MQTGVGCALVNFLLTLFPSEPWLAEALKVKGGEVGDTGASIQALNCQLDTVVSLVLTVDSLVAVETVAPVLLWSDPVVLFDTSAAVLTRRLSTCLNLQFLTILALVLIAAGASVIPRVGSLSADSPVLARLCLALVEVLVTKPSGPPGLTDTGVVVDTILANTIHTLVLQALIDVLLAHGAGEAGRAAALELVAWVRA